MTWAISTRVDAARDLVIVESTPIDYLDFASPETKREWGRKIRMSEEIVEKVTGKWASYGLPRSGRPISR